MRVPRSWLAFCTLSLALPAIAQPPSPPPAPSAGEGMTLDQYLARQNARIMAADTDGDGKISRAELAATARNGRDPARHFDEMDTNHDGVLDAGEIRAALTAKFRRMDRNGDGVVTPDERMAGRKHGRHGETADPAAAPQP